MTADITLPSDWKPIGAIAAGKTDTEKGKYLWAFSGVFDGDMLTKYYDALGFDYSFMG